MVNKWDIKCKKIWIKLNKLKKSSTISIHYGSNMMIIINKKMNGLTILLKNQTLKKSIIQSKNLQIFVKILKKVRMK